VTTTVRSASHPDGSTPEQVILKTPNPATRPRDIQIMFLLDPALFTKPPIAHMYSIDFGCGHIMIPSVTRIGDLYAFMGQHMYAHDGTPTVTLKSSERNPLTIHRQSRIRLNGSHEALFAEGVIGFTGRNFVQWMSRPLEAEVELLPPDKIQRIDRFRYVVRRDCSDGIADCYPSVMTTRWSTGTPLTFTPNQPGRWILDVEFRRKNDPVVRHGNPQSLTLTAFVPAPQG
jgi:hypothetical protein